MGVLDLMRAGAEAARNAPPASQDQGHPDAYGAIGAALQASQTPQEKQQAASPPPTLFNLINTSAIDAIRNGGTQAQQQPQEGNDVPSAQQQKFVQDVYPHAVEAAKQIGVDPSVLVAQAGLETGWGAKFAKNADGSDSFNYFNIKAGKGWDGATTAPTTTHEQNASGQAHVEADTFRSYSNAGQSFSDYVKFLQANPRYKEVLANAKGQDARSYATALQKAGYATDVDYGKKVAGTAATVARIAAGQ